MTAWHSTKKWGPEPWTLPDAQNYVADDIHRLHQTQQGMFGWVQNNVTVPAAGYTSNTPTILPYTPDWNGSMCYVLIMDYVSTLSGAPTNMQAQTYLNSGSAIWANVMKSTLAQYMMTDGAGSMAIASGTNPTIHVDAIVDTGSIKANLSVICWIVGVA